MYASALLYLAGTPLALGSFWGLLPFVAMIPFLIWRLYDEESFLARNLSGYAEYQRSGTALSLSFGRRSVALRSGKNEKV